MPRSKKKHDEDNSESISLGWRSRLINELLSIETECAEEGWDGVDALPIARRSLYAAKAFIDALPENVDVPDVIPENTGTISFDWVSRKGQIFSVSISECDYIFAGNVHGRQFNGKGRFQDELPEEIALELAKHFQV